MKSGPFATAQRQPYELPWHADSGLSLNSALDATSIASSQHNLLVTPELPITVTSESWSQSPTSTSNMFSFNPMIASSRATPIVEPYHDPNYLYPYHYQDEWKAGPWTAPSPPEARHALNAQHELVQEYVENDRPTFYINPQMEESHSPIISISHGTPVIHASSGMGKLVLPTTLVQMYTPPLEMQFMNPPTTPSGAWYQHSSVNSHRFIFPPP